MAEKLKIKDRPASADWFVQGVLTKIGDTFDRLTGRGWKPSSSLATSELAERLKALVDDEVRETAEKHRYVPHNIKLKMQWDKFSTDSDTALTTLENELLTALIDHINDRRYYTYAPVSLIVKPDYFINGVKLFASFDESDDDEREVSLNVTVPNVEVGVPPQLPVPKPPRHVLKLRICFSVNGKPVEKFVEMESGERTSIGRTKENDIAIEETSISKMHASLLVNGEGGLVVADTGSTNGTFIDGERIAYGKAIPIFPGRKLKFGSVEVDLEVVEQTQIEKAEPVEQDTETSDSTYRIGEFEFTAKQSEPPGDSELPAQTVESIPLPEPQPLDLISGQPAATEPSVKFDGIDNAGVDAVNEK